MRSQRREFFHIRRRLRAADRILERGKQGLETEDIEVRLAALEQAAELPKPPERY